MIKPFKTGSAIMTLDEDSILAEITQFLPQNNSVISGPGDDCAIIDTGTDRLMLLTVDQLVAETHYLTGKTPIAKIAGKLLKRNLSDIAAMGGRPQNAVMTIAANFAERPSETENWREWLIEFFKAMGEESAKWGVSVCGGDLSSTTNTHPVMTLTLYGSIEKDKVLKRSEAQSGDLIFCTGSFGASFSSGHHLDFQPRIEEGGFLALNNFAKAMMDVSDGLAHDLKRMAIASTLTAKLDVANIPIRNGADLDQALNEGEDYELLFAVDPANISTLEKKWPFKSTPITQIGEFIDGPPGEILFLNQEKQQIIDISGYDHFNK